MTNLRIQDYQGNELAWIPECGYFPHKNEQILVKGISEAVHAIQFESEGNTVTAIMYNKKRELPTPEPKKKKKKVKSR